MAVINPSFQPLFLIPNLVSPELTLMAGSVLAQIPSGSAGTGAAQFARAEAQPGYGNGLFNPQRNARPSLLAADLPVTFERGEDGKGSRVYDREEFLTLLENQGFPRGSTENALDGARRNVRQKFRIVSQGKASITIEMFNDEDATKTITRFKLTPYRRKASNGEWQDCKALVRPKEDRGSLRWLNNSTGPNVDSGDDAVHVPRRRKT